MNFGDFAKYYDISHKLHFGAKYDQFRENTVKKAEFEKYERILEFGCGTSLCLEYIERNKHYDGMYVGLDISRPMLLHAKSKSAANDKSKCFHIQIAKTGHLPLKDSSVDAIFSTLVFHLLDGARRAFVLDEFKRLLKPGGKIFLNEFGYPTTFLGRISKYYTLDFWALFMKEERNARHLFDGKFKQDLENLFTEVDFFDKSKGVIDHIAIDC